MKKVILLIMIISMLMTSVAFAKDTYVRGYYRSNGTYVQPHYRTTPNSTRLDNYSTKGNINPYTGKHGTVNPYRIPTYKSGNIFKSPSYSPKGLRHY